VGRLPDYRRAEDDLEHQLKVQSWRDVRSSYPDVRLKLFGPGTDSGTFDFFTEVINGKVKASRSDYLATEDDNVIVSGVQGERGALGYSDSLTTKRTPPS
jgi:phosphate transport system substrate-binding protein